MSKRHTVRFVFSEKNSKLFGYNIGITKDGKIFSYTTVLDDLSKIERSFYEKEGDTVYEGVIEDLVAIKNYYGDHEQIIKNNTGKKDPFLTNDTVINESIQSVSQPDRKEKDIQLCGFGKNVVKKIKQVNQKINNFADKIDNKKSS